MAGEEGLALPLLLLAEGDLTDRLGGGVVSSSAIANALKSSRSNAFILRYNISNLYIRAERRS